MTVATETRHTATRTGVLCPSVCSFCSLARCGGIVTPLDLSTSCARLSVSSWSFFDSKSLPRLCTLCRLLPHYISWGPSLFATFIRQLNSPHHASPLLSLLLTHPRAPSPAPPASREAGPSSKPYVPPKGPLTPAALGPYILIVLAMLHAAYGVLTDPYVCPPARLTPESCPCSSIS
jgi:hypothetical protein